MSDFGDIGPDPVAPFPDDDAESARYLARLIAEIIRYAETQGCHTVADALAQAHALAEGIARGYDQTSQRN